MPEEGSRQVDVGRDNPSTETAERTFSASKSTSHMKDVIINTDLGENGVKRKSLEPSDHEEEKRLRKEEKRIRKEEKRIRKAAKKLQKERDSHEKQKNGRQGRKKRKRSSSIQIEDSENFVTNTAVVEGNLETSGSSKKRKKSNPVALNTEAQHSATLQSGPIGDHLTTGGSKNKRTHDELNAIGLPVEGHSVEQSAAETVIPAELGQKKRKKLAATSSPLLAAHQTQSSTDLPIQASSDLPHAPRTPHSPLETDMHNGSRQGRLEGTLSTDQQATSISQETVVGNSVDDVDDFNDRYGAPVLLPMPLKKHLPLKVPTGNLTETAKAERYKGLTKDEIEQLHAAYTRESLRFPKIFQDAWKHTQRGRLDKYPHLWLVPRLYNYFYTDDQGGRSAILNRTVEDLFKEFPNLHPNFQRLRDAKMERDYLEAIRNVVFVAVNGIKSTFGNPTKVENIDKEIVKHLTGTAQAPRPHDLWAKAELAKSMEDDPEPSTTKSFRSQWEAVLAEAEAELGQKFNQLPEAEQKIWSDLAANPEASVDSATALATGLPFVNLVVKRFNELTHVPMVILMGAPDPSHPGKILVYHDSYSPAPSNVPDFFNGPDQFGPKVIVPAFRRYLTLCYNAENDDIANAGISLDPNCGFQWRLNHSNTGSELPELPPSIRATLKPTQNTTSNPSTRRPHQNTQELQSRPKKARKASDSAPVQHREGSEDEAESSDSSSASGEFSVGRESSLGEGCKSQTEYVLRKETISRAGRRSAPPPGPATMLSVSTTRSADEPTVTRSDDRNQIHHVSETPANEATPVFVSGFQPTWVSGGGRNAFATLDYVVKAPGEPDIITLPVEVTAAVEHVRDLALPSPLKAGPSSLPNLPAVLMHCARLDILFPASAPPRLNLQDTGHSDSSVNASVFNSFWEVLNDFHKPVPTSLEAAHLASSANIAVGLVSQRALKVLESLMDILEGHDMMDDTPARTMSFISWTEYLFIMTRYLKFLESFKLLGEVPKSDYLSLIHERTLELAVIHLVIRYCIGAVAGHILDHPAVSSGSLPSMANVISTLGSAWIKLVKRSYRLINKTIITDILNVNWACLVDPSGQSSQSYPFYNLAIPAKRWMTATATDTLYQAIVLLEVELHTTPTLLENMPLYQQFTFLASLFAIHQHDHIHGTDEEWLAIIDKILDVFNTSRGGKDSFEVEIAPIQPPPTLVASVAAKTSKSRPASRLVKSSWALGDIALVDIEGASEEVIFVKKHKYGSTSGYLVMARQDPIREITGSDGESELPLPPFDAASLVSLGSTNPVETTHLRVPGFRLGQNLGIGDIMKPEYAGYFAQFKDIPDDVDPTQLEQRGFKTPEYFARLYFDNLGQTLASRQQSIPGSSGGDSAPPPIPASNNPPGEALATQYHSDSASAPDSGHARQYRIHGTCDTSKPSAGSGEGSSNPGNAESGDVGASNDLSDQGTVAEGSNRTQQVSKPGESPQLPQAEPEPGEGNEELEVENTLGPPSEATNLRSDAGLPSATLGVEAGAQKPSSAKVTKPRKEQPPTRVSTRKRNPGPHAQIVLPPASSAKLKPASASTSKPAPKSALVSASAPAIPPAPALAATASSSIATNRRVSTRLATSAERSLIGPSKDGTGQHRNK
ncbi:hypothetical protein FRB90_007158 [Tulasnella sp. 427]|nr:hypothetical protein FRB90_007158 [Tulasnella sp. 427]